MDNHPAEWMFGAFREHVDAMPQQHVKFKLEQTRISGEMELDEAFSRSKHQKPFILRNDFILTSSTISIDLLTKWRRSGKVQKSVHFPEKRKPLCLQITLEILELTATRFYQPARLKGSEKKEEKEVKPPPTRLQQGTQLEFVSDGAQLLAEANAVGILDGHLCVKWEGKGEEGRIPAGRIKSGTVCDK